jgi:hypothetical protein
LRRDVVEDWRAVRPPDAARKRQVETARIHQNHEIGRALRDGLAHPSPRGRDAASATQQLDHAAHREISLMDDQLDTSPLHPGSAESEEGRVLIALAKGANEVGCVRVSRSIAG